VRSSVASLLVRRPIEATYRFLGQLEGRRVEPDRAAARGAYTPDPRWLEELRQQLGADQIQTSDGFESCWAQIEDLAGDLQVESHDGDAALARAVWEVVRRSRATRVVETGVARGVSSRVTLEALAPIEDAHLWSVDLPLLAADWSGLLASAIPERLRRDWTYVRGPSRRVLPRLLAQVGPIDLFVQDSRSTVPTASFEFNAAWGALKSGGFLIANSVDRSVAFQELVKRARPSFAVTAAFERKPGLFGIAQKT
jgi:hypothetical protein